MGRINASHSHIKIHIRRASRRPSSEIAAGFVGHVVHETRTIKLVVKKCKTYVLGVNHHSPENVSDG